MVTRTCAHCSSQFQAPIRRVADERRAMRVRGAFVEHVHPAAILARDAWTCHLCGDAIDQGAKWPHPLSPSMDHVIPVSLGGEHSTANVRASHLACNVRKQNRLVPSVV